MLLKVKNIDFSYESSKTLDDITFQVKGEVFLGVMGPNGSGKTTLLRCISNVLSPHHGTVLIDKNDIRSLRRKDIAKNIGVVPQTSKVDFAFTVLEIVLMGRTPHIEGFKTESSMDYEITRNAMKSTNTLHLSDRAFDELSGGEKQRVIIARALAQQPKILLLDEPTVHLDISCQFEIMDLVKRLNEQEKIVVISVFHDLNLAAQYCDNLLLLDDGKIVSIGPPDDVLTPENIKNTYHVDVIIKKHPFMNTPYVTPYVPLKQQDCQKEITVHIVCGGGSGSQLMMLLSNNSLNITAGVLNVLDSDFETAKTLNVTVVGEIPFSQITQKSHETNIDLIKKADLVLLTDFPVGFGNLKNIEAVEIARDMNIPVIVIESTLLEQKDFTDGELKKYFTRLKNKKALFVGDTEEACKIVEEFHRE